MIDQLTQAQQQAVLQLEPRAKAIARRYGKDEDYAGVAVLELCQSVGPYIPPLDEGQQMEVLNRVRDRVRIYHRTQLWEKERGLQGGEPSDVAYTEHAHQGRSTTVPGDMSGQATLLATMTTGIAANVVDPRIPENEGWVALVEEVVQALPPSLQATAASHWIYNTTAEEIAKDEEVSVRAIEKRLHRAREYAFLFLSGGKGDEWHKTWTQGRTVASIQRDQFTGHKDFDSGDGAGPFVCPLATDGSTGEGQSDTKPGLPRPAKGTLAAHGRRTGEPCGSPLRTFGRQLKRVRRSFTEKYDLQQRVEGEYRGTLNYRLWRWLLDSAALVRSVCENGGVLCGLSATTL